MTLCEESKQKHVGGVELTGDHDFSRSLLNTIANMKETNDVVYIAPGKRLSRQAQALSVVARKIIKHWS